MKFVLLVCAAVSVVLGAPHENINDRIIGGTDGDISWYPYILQLEYYGELVCGATLVSLNYALTAGHCVVSKSIEAFTVRAGSATLYEGGEEFELEEIQYHPNYDVRNNNYDAALLLLSAQVTVPNAQPIKLATNDDAIAEGVSVTVAGWGWSEFTYYAEFSTTLQVIDLPILGYDQCMSAHDIVTDVMFCVAYLEGAGRGYCWGDNGGPAVINGVLVGIISFGQGCGDGVHAGVLIRASVVRDWVESIIAS